MTHPERRYKELDALRGLAALMVIFFHFIWGRPDSGLKFGMGNMGVDLFFIISGFVIFMSLTKVKSGLQFVINRVSRLYPAYWACVTLSFIILNIYYHYTIIDFPKLHFDDYLMNLTMFQFYMKTYDIDGPYWTMIIEMLFYILMFFLLQYHQLKNVRIIGIILSLVLISAANFFWNEAVQFIFRWVPLFSYFPLFFAGIIFYKIYSKEEGSAKNYLTILFCILAQISLFNSTGRIIFLDLFTYTCGLLLFFGIFILLVNNKLKFLVVLPILFIGRVSFPLYLTHQFISLNILLPYFIDTLHINYYVATLVLTLPILLIIATIITFGVEILGQRLMKRKLYRVFKLA